MKRTIYRTDLMDAAKDVMRKSRKSMDAFEDEYQPT